MTVVDFYVLSRGGDADVLRTACRIVQKAWSQGLRIYVLACDDAQRRRMDELLWSFKQDSFVPHELWPPAQPTAGTNESAPLAPILIGSTTEVSPAPQVLINLGAAVPQWYSSCERIAEIVGADPQRKADGRARYRTYREFSDSGEQGVSLRTHEV